MNKDELVYLASPYSHPDGSVRLFRFNEACKAASKLMSQGVLVFSPIAHSHPIACAGDLGLGWDYWERFDRAMLKACAGLVVLKLKGWDTSVGINAEMKIMREAGKRIEFMDWLE